jgi:hypothetical protein
MAPLYHHDGPVGLPSICEEEPETERTEASIPDEFQLLFAQFIQKIMLKMLAFIDVILAPNASTTREVCVSNLSILLCVHGAVSKALSATRMKTERKYPEPTVFVFYIMIPFLNIKNCQFQLVSQSFSTIFYIL